MTICNETVFCVYLQSRVDLDLCLNSYNSKKKGTKKTLKHSVPCKLKTIWWKSLCHILWHIIYTGIYMNKNLKSTHLYHVLTLILSIFFSKMSNICKYMILSQMIRKYVLRKKISLSIDDRHFLVSKSSVRWRKLKHVLKYVFSYDIWKDKWNI